MKKTIDSVLEFCDRNSLLKESVSNNMPVTKTDITNAALRKIGYRKISFDPSDMSGSNSLRSFRCAEIFKETVNEIAKELGFIKGAHYEFNLWSTDAEKTNEAMKVLGDYYVAGLTQKGKDDAPKLKKKASELEAEIASSEEHKKAIEMLIDALAEKFRISVPR